MGTAILHREVIGKELSGGGGRSRARRAPDRGLSMKKIFALCLLATMAGSTSAETGGPGSQEFTPNSPGMLNFNKQLAGPAELPGGNIKILRVQKVSDPRCPDMSSEDLSRVFDEAKKLAKKQLGLELMFNMAGDMPLSDFFNDEDSRLAGFFINSGPLSSTGVAASGMDEGTAEMIRNGGWRDLLQKTEYDIWTDDPEPSLGKMLAQFATEENKKLPAFFPTELKISKKLTGADKQKLLEYFKDRQAALKAIKGGDDKPLLDQKHKGYFSSNRWRKLIQGNPTYDFVITNTLLLDTSKRFALASFTRGGVLNGFIASIRPAIGVVSTYPILSDSDFFRGRDIRTREERVSALATIIIHELGHQLRGLDDDFTGKGVLMTPPQGFQYKKWYETVRKSAPTWKPTN